MDWRKCVVSKSLDVKGRTIIEIMSWYHEYSLIVNRKYQRKLVWNLKEKRLFIDSIINKYPTPSVIISCYDGYDENGKPKDYYEIIDGLQRLNAIVSFVDNEYGIIIDGKEYFYDMQFIPTTVRRRLAKKSKQREPILNADICESFAIAEIPVILTSQKEGRDEKIEKIFQRINSSGRKLSAHDIRQASSTGEFPDLVRRISTNCRGDFTYYDEINLCDMPKISLKSQGLNYGIDPDTTFWRKHDIIPFERFRQSKDEEVIASAMAIVLIGKDFRINANNLNSLYRPNTKEYDTITEIINNFGKDKLEMYAKEVINQIDNIFDSVSSTFSDYLYPKKNSAAKDFSFITLFCTLYQLNREGYFIEDNKQIACLLKNHFDSTFGLLLKKSDHDNCVRTMDMLYSLLKQSMVKKIHRNKTSDEELLESLLSLSTIETQMVEFKIGITYFESGKLNHNEIEKIWQTLVAIANTNYKKQSEGYVIIGVANNNQSCKNWRAVYKEMPLTYGSHKIVGITKEATTYFLDEDHYEQRFRELIKNSRISEPLKEYVLSNYRIINFHEKTLLLVPSTRQNAISYYDNKFYIREGTSTVHKSEMDIK